MESEKQSLHIIMPVYNEDEVIVSVLDQWVQTLDHLHIDYQLHVFDDGSRDTTLAVLNQAGPRWPGVVIHHHNNQGHGPTILSGYLLAHEVATWVFQTDSDDEMSPASFEPLWRAREDHDFLIGRRSNQQRPWARRIISAISRQTVRLFYGRGIQDVNCPYRLMRTSFFNPCFRTIPRETFAPNVLISGYACLNNARIKEFDIPYTERQTGTVSIAKWCLLRVAIKSLWQTICYRFADSTT